MKLVIQKCAVIFILLLQNSLSYGAYGDCMYQPGTFGGGTFFNPKVNSEETRTIKGTKYWCCGHYAWNQPTDVSYEQRYYNCRELVKDPCKSVGASNSAKCNDDTPKFGEK